MPCGGRRRRHVGGSRRRWRLSRRGGLRRRRVGCSRRQRRGRTPTDRSRSRRRRCQLRSCELRPKIRLPGRRDPSELLDVDVDELAWPLSFVAIRRLQPARAESLSDPDPRQDRQRDGRERHREHLGDLGCRHPQPAQRNDRRDPLGSGRAGTPARPRRAIQQPLAALRPPTCEPLSRRPLTHTSRGRGRSRRPPLLDPRDQQPTATRTGPRVSVQLHHGPPWPGVPGSSQTPRRPG